MAITLNANLYLGTLSNLIAYTQINYVAEKGEMSRLVASCQDINVDNGDGKVVRSADLPSVGNLSGVSSLLTPAPPTVDEQYVDVQNYKVIQMTVNRYLMRGAFVEESAMANFIAYLLQIMRTAKEAYIYGALVGLIENYAPTLATQVVTVPMFDTTGLLDPAQLERANTYNAKALQKALIKTLQAMGAPSAKFNDKAYTEVIDFSSLKLIVKSTPDTDLLVDSLATLLNSGKITEAQKWSETIVIPDDQFSVSADPTHLCWLCHNKKFQFGYFYEVATSFFDASTLNQSDWLHFAYYLASIDALPCVRFEADYSLTPTALQ